MKDYSFRKLKSCLILMSCMLFIFTGCGKGAANAGNSVDGSESGAASSQLTREEYVGLVGQYFGLDNYETEQDFFTDVSVANRYYSNIQACAEWDVIRKDNTFRPTEEATVEFALATAVRAIGLDELQLTEDSVDDRVLADFYVNNIAQLDKAGYEKGITQKVADQILQYALDYENNMELPQYVNIEYQPGVKEANGKIMVPAAGNTGILLEGHGYQVDDIVYIDDSLTDYPKGIRITSITGNQFTFEEVTVEEVFSKLELYGTFDGEITNVFSASDNVGIYDEDIYYPTDMRQNGQEYFLTPLANGVKIDKGKDHVTFVASITEDGNKAELRFGIKNIKVTTAYKHHSHVLDPEEARLKVDFDVAMEASSELHCSKTIPLGSIDIKIVGPMFAKLSLTANIGADGEVNLDYSIHNTANTEWKKGRGVSKSFTTSTSAEADGEITLTAEMTTLADLVVKFFGDHSIMNAQVTTGVVIIAKTEVDLLGNQPACNDILGYVPLRWGVNQKGCLITAINKNWKMRGTIWDSKTSEFIMHRHIEDGARTPDDQCTRGEGEKVVQETEKADGTPLSEYDLFRFEPISFDFIELKEYAVFLDRNGQGRISFTSIPEGFTEENLMYTVEDPSVCKVQNGQVVGMKTGTSLVKISTPDGMFSVTLAVIVNDDYTIEGGFEEL